MLFTGGCRVEKDGKEGVFRLAFAGKGSECTSNVPLLCKCNHYFRILVRMASLFLNRIGLQYVTR